MHNNNHATVKVVSQVLKLVYEGIRQKTNSVSKMNALLGIATPVSKKDDKDVKTSLSRELYTGYFSTEEDGESAAPARPVSLCTEQTVNRFMALGDIATSKRKTFFEKVEEGKSRLLAKYGENKAVPKEEVVSLAEELRPYACTIWKHQIVVTRTQSTPFEGARRTRDGRYTATVKSKTIYTMEPLTESQLDELERILKGELEPSSDGSVAIRQCVSGDVYLWVNQKTGKIVMSEDKSQCH